MAAIKLENLSKHYKDEQILNNVNLTLETGETIAVFGPSGCGKTVLLRLIAGVEEPTAGRIELHGEDMQDVAPEQRGLGMAFQNFALFPHMDAYANIASPLQAGKSSADKIREGVMSVARLLKIDHVLDHTPRALSNGQKQRTALARALASRPRILLLDDPLRNVDAKLRFEMRLELPQLLAEQQASVLYVTQDYKEAMALGDRIAVMGSGGHDGLVQLGTPDEIYFRPANLEVASLFGDPAINTFPVTPVLQEGHWRVPLAGVSQLLPRPLDVALRETPQTCIAAIRPEAVRLVAESDGQAQTLEVLTVTPVNEKVVVMLGDGQGLELLASLPAHLPVPAVGERVAVQLPVSDLLLFERDSGRRIATENDTQPGGAA
ncbi:MAG: ABC transporter ATP-binding protein [Thiolinea sp.]